MPPSAKNVLVIDDDAVMRELLSIVLGADGHEILTADSGGSALTLTTAEPDVILTDLQMPGLIGAPLAARLREKFPAALLLAMSGTQPPADQTAPFDAFLRKPFSIADFYAAIAIKPLATTSDPTSHTPPQSEPTALDETVYAKLSTTMPPAQLQQLYTMALDDARTRIERMTASAAAGDAAAFTREAHAIKGGCGMLGASELHALASRMETGALLCTSLLNDFTLAATRLRRILDART